MIQVYETQSVPNDVYYNVVREFSDDTPMREIAKEVKRLALAEVSQYEPCLVEFGESEGFPFADIFKDNRCIHKFFVDQY